MNAKKGDVIMVAKPYAYVLSMKERGRRCDACFEKNEKLLRCTQCSFARYCDKDCQKAAWSFHKEECQCLVRVAPKIPQDNVRLMFQVVQRLKRGDANKLFSYDPGLKSFNSFMSHADEIRQDSRRMEQFAQMFYTLKIFVGNLFELPSPGDLLEMFGKMTVNSFTICDPEMQPIGGGMYLSPAYFDHNCSFNAVVTFNGLRLEVRALKDLKGEEVYISYIDQLGLTEERQRSLREQYYFTCDCTMCQDVDLEHLMQSTKCPKCPEPVLQNSDGSFAPCSCGYCEFDEVYKQKKFNAIDSSMKILHVIDEAKKTRKSSPEEILSQSEECLAKQEILHEFNVFRVRALDKAFDACIDLQKWEEALKYGVQTVEPYKRLYPSDCHPNIGIQLMKIGKIQLYLHKLSPALCSLQQAESVLSVSHGKAHPLYNDLMSLTDQCQEEMKSVAIEASSDV